MIKDKLQIEEAKEFLVLAKIYYGIAQCRGNKKEYLRGVIDASYNSTELCAKGLLKLKMLEIPSTHRGIVKKFGEYYIKTDIIDRELGRVINKSLRLRNRARYECKAEITETDAKEVEKFTKIIIKILEEKLKDSNNLI